jgi:hypothetical protein
VPPDDPVKEIAALWEEAYYLTHEGEVTPDAAAQQAADELKPYEKAVEDRRSELDELKAQKGASSDDLEKAEAALDKATLALAQAPRALLHRKGRWALCLSGGGIRSATFGLGVIQGLAERGLLNRFQFLSTVSGGGYIGSWLSAWAHRHPEGLAGVQASLRNALDRGDEPHEVSHLRSYSNFLTPKLGLLSADTSTVIATYMRNLLLHLLLLLPLLVVPIFVPKLGVGLMLQSQFGFLKGWYGSHLLWVGWGTGAVGAVALAYAIVYAGVCQPSVSAHLRVPRGTKAAVPDRARFLWRCLLPMVFAACALSLGWFWIHADPTKTTKHFDHLTWLLFLIGAGALLRGLGWFATYKRWRWMLRIHGLTPPAANGNNVALRTLPQLLAGLLCGALGGALVAVVLLMIIDMPELTPLYVATYASFVPPLLLLVFLTTESIYIGLVCYRTQDEDREWWARSGGWLLLAGLGWIILNLVSFFGSGTLTYLFDEHEKILAALGISGGASGVVSALLGKSAITSALQKDKNGDGITGQLSKLVLPMLALIFILALFIALAAGVDWVVLRAVDAAGLVEDRARWHGLCGDQNWCKAVADTQAIGLSGAFFALVVVAVFCLVLSRFININRFSLHATYRSRLIRAYLGASRRERKPDAFTGFDPKDNIRFRTILEGDQKREPTGRFLHLVCIALNLVGGERLDWQQRKASSFTVSALHSGARILGYRRSSEYGAEKGISLGTAMAISGAAASPNMGYHSSALVAFVMTLFNVRLGWWLGNPGEAGTRYPLDGAGGSLPKRLWARLAKLDRSYRRDGPRLAVAPLIAELFALTRDDKPHVYLSDGGHFENLGLYEMVLRRSTLIVVSDAGCDPDCVFDDLANAIRKIRVDLGVEIVMREKRMYRRLKDEVTGIKVNDKGRYWAVGTIRYPELDNEGKHLTGTLLYLKPGIYGAEPTDLMNYAAGYLDFPHESTGDQWFSESQFESYRALGLHIAQAVLGDLDATEEPVNANELVGAVEEYAYGA